MMPYQISLQGLRHIVASRHRQRNPHWDAMLLFFSKI
jgi:hypothetical protein